MKKFILLAGIAAACIIVSNELLSKSTGDHSKYPSLKVNFTRPEQVTRACLECHNKAGFQVMRTSHWLWSRKTDKMPGKEGQIMDVGKRNVINNFCVAVKSNWPRCTSCHIGYGWKDENFDFTDQSKIDCLVCHDTTGTYQKFPTGAGYPVLQGKKMFKGNKKWYEKPDYKTIVQKVGRPTRKNCGTCHFYGGGGNAVKHGALDKSLLKPTKDIDVHMGSDGGNMTCVDCHVADKHDIKGQLYSVSVENRDRISCERCHTRRPHTQKLFLEEFMAEQDDIFKQKLYEREAPENTFIHRLLDKHTERIACQTCHIKHYSTKYKTKVWWDWSKAGKFNKKGKPLVVKDSDGDKLYDGKKGEFKLVKNAVPEYYWFTGEVWHMLLGDTFDPEKTPVELNRISGECGDPGARIWPFKVMRGNQLYDPVNKMMIVPKLFGKKGTGAYWGDWDWNKSAAAGMKAAGLPYSGEYDWIETKMYWPLAHLVLSKEESLTCDDCHARESRLAGVPACWIPGRDRSLIFDIFGIILIVGSFIGVGVHGFIRYRTSTTNKEE